MTLKALAAVVLAALAALAAAPAQKEKKPRDKTAQPKPPKPPEPLHVWAERIHYIQEKNLADITGPATIIKGDMRIDAQHVLAELDEKTGEFRKMTATGNVRVYSIIPIEKRAIERPPLQLAPDGRAAECDKATYDAATGITVLHGTPEAQPVVRFGKDEARADLITHDSTKQLLTFIGRVSLTALLPTKPDEPPPAKK
mgnify:CR=1 FL=1